MRIKNNLYYFKGLEEGVEPSIVEECFEIAQL